MAKLCETVKILIRRGILHCINAMCPPECTGIIKTLWTESEGEVGGMEMMESKVSLLRVAWRVTFTGVMLITHQLRELHRTQLKRANYRDCWHSSRTFANEQNRIECFIIQLKPLAGILLTLLCLASPKRDSGKQYRPRSDDAKRGVWSSSTPC